MKKIANLFIGKKRWQKFFERLDHIALAGMNMGRGGDPRSSGEEKALRDTVGPNRQPVIFDVGASYGNYSILAHKLFGWKSDIYAFEPSVHAFDVLEGRVPGVVSPYNFGFSDKEEKTTLYGDVSGSGLGSLYDRDLSHVGLEMKSREIVHLRTIDDFCKEKEIKHIDFLKLDIEGHEIKALKGAKKMMENGNIGAIQFEFGGANLDSRTYFRDFWNLLSAKYDMFRIVKDGLQPIPEYAESLERFVNTNFVAVKKD